MRSRQEIAESILGCALEDGIYATCPGAAKHSKVGGKRDFRVVLDGAPTAYCFHTSCGAEVDEFNRELRRAIWREEHGQSVPNPWNEGVAGEPKQRHPSHPKLDRKAVDEFIRGTPEITTGWMAERSVVDVAKCSSEEFLGYIFRKEERALVFTSFYSQGDFVCWQGHGTYRLSKDRQVRAVPSALPKGSKEGVWFLSNPVSGKWEINPARQKEGKTEWTRRSEINATGFRHFVLESDELPAELWLRVLVNLPLPIVAIYTSGGKSIHALVQAWHSSKAEWDASRNIIRALVCPLGADPAALTAVRLTRLPGCMRGDKKQRLLYLNPEAPEKPLILLPKLSA